MYASLYFRNGYKELLLDFANLKPKEQNKKITQRKFSTNFSNYLENNFSSSSSGFSKSSEEELQKENFKNSGGALLKNPNTHKFCVLEKWNAVVKYILLYSKFPDKNLVLDFFLIFLNQKKIFLIITKY